ncbi:MAG: anti-sigma-I factor RsgI family protein [Eubacteriales bacterium]|jgi:hypothetical protein
MKKYLVMECHLSYAVVLDNEGHFLKVANRRYKVGQTVNDVIEMQIPQSSAKKIIISKPMYLLAAVAACLVLILTSVLQLGNMKYASVYMTINPEVRIDVNRRDVVVGLDGVNADGDDLILGYDYKRKGLDLVINELVDRAIDMGYLHEGGQISLVLDADNAEWVVSRIKTLNKNLMEYVSEKLSVTVEVTDKKTQSNRIVIPIVPDESNYGDSDYGEDTSTASPAVSETNGDDRNDTDYGQNNDGVTDYDDIDYGPGNDGVTDYDDTDYGPGNDGVTDYDDTDYGPGNDSVTDYDDTDYGPGNDSVTDYDDTDYGPGNDSVTDYDDTDYGPNNDGVTDYDDTDYGPNNDGVTDYINTDYGPNNDDVTDHDDTDYGPYNDGVTDYYNYNYGSDDDGIIDYDDSDYGSINDDDSYDYDDNEYDD